MIKIALMGAPGCGKSTLAARLYSDIKDMGLRGELVQEYIREHINRYKKVPSIAYQTLIYERQLQRERILPTQLDFFVTDSPTILSYIYALKYCDMHNMEHRMLLSDMYNKTIMEAYDNYDLIYFLEHNVEPDIDDGVRYQNTPEIKELNDSILGFMNTHRLRYTLLDSTLNTAMRSEEILKDIRRIISKKID